MGVVRVAGRVRATQALSTVAGTKPVPNIRTSGLGDPQNPGAWNIIGVLLPARLMWDGWHNEGDRTHSACRTNADNHLRKPG